jgi:hypothetical protein
MAVEVKLLEVRYAENVHYSYVYGVSIQAIFNLSNANTIKQNQSTRHSVLRVFFSDPRKKRYHNKSQKLFQKRQRNVMS